MFKKKEVQPEDIVVFDTETTGFDPSKDEIIQFSAADGNGNTLLNTYIRPLHRKRWPNAEAVNHISPAMVKDSPTIEDLQEQIYHIINDARLLVAYNAKFDLKFLEAANCYSHYASADIYDVMLEFAPVYGKWNDRTGDYKWQKLTTAAQYYGYRFKAHDSMEDVLATLYVYNCLTRKIEPKKKR